MLPYFGELHDRLRMKSVGDPIEWRLLELGLGENVIQSGLASVDGIFGKWDLQQSLCAVVGVWGAVCRFATD